MLRIHGRQILLAFWFLLFAAISGWACECAGPRPTRCTLARGWGAVFLGTVTEKTNAGFRLRVDEQFTGKNREFIELVSLSCTFEGFKIGEQYVVFAASEDDGEHLFVPPCGPTRSAKYGQAILEQLRAEKNGRRVASVYGMLIRTLEPEIGIWDDNYVIPLSNVKVRLQSGKKSFEAKTDEQGAYAFEKLPAGTYQVSAELPPNLETAQRIREDPVPPFDLPAHSCYDYNVNAMPTGEIVGKVIGPDGVPLRSTGLSLYRVRDYKEGEAGLYAYQGEGKPFRFRHLPAGDYLVVFNHANQIDPDAPFPRTFYPGVGDFQNSQAIHLADGQKIADFDIRIKTAGLPTRKVAIRLDWNGESPENYYPPVVQVTGSEGIAPYPYQVATDSYEVSLLLSASYTIRAEAFCRGDSRGKAETDAPTVEGKNSSISEVTLTFKKGGCEHKP